MTSQTRLVLFLNQLVAWSNRHPGMVRLVIIIAMVLMATLLSYSVTYADPLGGGGGGCGC